MRECEFKESDSPIDPTDLVESEPEAALIFVHPARFDTFDRFIDHKEWSVRSFGVDYMHKVPNARAIYRPAAPKIVEIVESPEVSFRKYVVFDTDDTYGVIEKTHNLPRYRFSQMHAMHARLLEAQLDYHRMRVKFLNCGVTYRAVKVAADQVDHVLDEIRSWNEQAERKRLQRERQEPTEDEAGIVE